MKTDLTERALAFATLKHKDHVRKHTGLPYVTHLVNVAELVALHTDDHEMIAAALLHDTLEDTRTTLMELFALFGGRVAMLVNELTDVSTPMDGNRKARKALDRAHLAHASADAHTIKLADLIDNAVDIMEHDPDGFGHVYMNEKRELLKVLTKGDAHLMARAKAVMTRHTAAA